jgi:hypothetical protein
MSASSSDLAEGKPQIGHDQHGDDERWCHLGYAGVLAQVRAEGSNHEEQQTRRGEHSERGYREAEQDSCGTRDLQDPDALVGTDTEADVRGPGLHRRYGSDLACAQHRKGDSDEGGQGNKEWGSHCWISDFSRVEKSVCCAMSYHLR